MRYVDRSTFIAFDTSNTRTISDNSYNLIGEQRFAARPPCSRGLQAGCAARQGFSVRPTAPILALAADKGLACVHQHARQELGVRRVTGQPQLRMELFGRGERREAEGCSSYQ